MNNIIDLRETSPDHWQAKYDGNYGVYTIKINTDGKRRAVFPVPAQATITPASISPLLRINEPKKPGNTLSNTKTGGPW
jgi:hypothetical protein